MKKAILLITIILLSVSCGNNPEQKKSEEQNNQNSKKETPGTAFEPTIYKKKGKEIAMATFKVFKGHIQKVAAEKGLPAVVNFCNKEALKLTDSMSQVYHVKIKRTSHKLRNEKNAPNADEQKVLNTYLQSLEAGKPLQPVVEKDADGYVHFYAPIKIKKACLSCHGTVGKEVSPEIYKIIKEKYPNDKAIGFKEGDLRGIWDIKFTEELK